MTIFAHSPCHLLGPITLPALSSNKYGSAVPRRQPAFQHVDAPYNHAGNHMERYVMTSSAPASRDSRRVSAPELLAPAGGPAPFAAALAAGADAIYCGMGSFNARRKADNFTDETFEQACRAAHLAGARVYVTVNIVIKDEEMVEALELVRRCAQLGADAFIIQDWGLFHEIRRLMPQLETHISTQANIHDARGTAWCRDAGADRVTLSRELSVSEIATISNVGIDLEVFAHGAICFCYSGVCLLSSFARSRRSANRGMCAQPCRLPYDLVDEKGRVLSPANRERPLCPRDTNTSQMLGELLDAGASALKLEGRMKAPDYVYSIVDVYRRQLDDAIAGRTVSQTDAVARARQLKRCFNRDFTTEYQRGASGDEMMSYERSNNRGQLVGEVIASRPTGRDVRGLHPDDKRRRAAIARIRLDEPVDKGDLLELRHDDEFDQFLTTLASDDAAAGDIIECNVARAMPAGSRVRVIRSQRAIDVANAALKRDILRRRSVKVHIRARLGEPFSVTLSCADNPSQAATATGFTVEAARTRPVSREDLIEHVGRMGSSPFEAASYTVDMDPDCGMGFSSVHKVRAAACKALEDVILAPHAVLASELDSLAPLAQTALTASSPARYVSSPASGSIAPAVSGSIASAASGSIAPAVSGSIASAASGSSAPATPGEPSVCVAVATLQHAALARELGADVVYATTDSLDAANVSPSHASELDIVPLLDEVCREDDHARIDPWIIEGATVSCGNISELALASQRGAKAQIRSCIPVHNLACATMLSDAGATLFWLSPELTLAEIERFCPQAAADTQASFGIEVFGKPRVMTSEHCILQVANACIHNCSSCRLRSKRLWLRNIDGKLLPVITDVHGRSHLYDSTTIDITPQIPQLLAAGVTHFMVDATLMDEDELKRAVTHARRSLDSALAGRAPGKRLQGTSAGCLFVGVD